MVTTNEYFEEPIEEETQEEQPAENPRFFGSGKKIRKSNAENEEAEVGAPVVQNENGGRRDGGFGMQRMRQRMLDRKERKLERLSERGLGEGDAKYDRVKRRAEHIRARLNEPRDIFEWARLAK